MTVSAVVSIIMSPILTGMADIFVAFPLTPDIVNFGDFSPLTK
jgi:hypothetical protein